MVLLESDNIPIGTPASDFELEGISFKSVDATAGVGAKYGLRDFSDSKILVIIFMCNHCPYVQAVWSRLVDLQEKYKDQSVRFVGINPNNNPDYPEETLEHMQEYYKKYDMNFPYLLDETQEVAREYGAQCTPDVFVYDKERKLKYHGRIDDNWKDPEQVTKYELDEAIQALLNDEKSAEPQNPSIGCSIKWVE